MKSSGIRRPNPPKRLDTHWCTPPKSSWTGSRVRVWSDQLISFKQLGRSASWEAGNRKGSPNDTVVKVYGATPKFGGLVRGYDKPIHGSCAIYFPGGILELRIEMWRLHAVWCLKMPFVLCMWRDAIFCILGNEPGDKTTIYISTLDNQRSIYGIYNKLDIWWYMIS